MTKTTSLLNDKGLWLDIFILLNISFLAVDIYFAHSVNEFSHQAEWVPLYFSVFATLCLLLMLIKRQSKFDTVLGITLGLVSVIIGIAGLYFHLESQFFQQGTIRSLVYTAPFIAPLAYAGLGFLLIMQRMLDLHTKEWGQWIVFFALGGFFGNFVLTLCDHAQTGFHMTEEWIPVVASAIAIGFLFQALELTVSKAFLKLTMTVMVIQIIVGTLGFYYHLNANLDKSGEMIWDNFVYGAPIFAPLLFPNLALLAIIGLVDLISKQQDA